MRKDEYQKGLEVRKKPRSMATRCKWNPPKGVTLSEPDDLVFLPNPAGSVNGGRWECLVQFEGSTQPEKVVLGMLEVVNEAGRLPERGASSSKADCGNEQKTA